MKIASLAIYAIAGGFVIVGAYYGVTRALGAHPFWDTQIALIGAPIGLALAALLHAMGWRWALRFLTFLVLLACAGTAAHQGRLQFAASFAENQLAGKFWYFGWIASAAALSGLFATLLTPRRTASK